MIEAALALASGETLGRACPIFPLQPGGKRPLPGSSGWKDATADAGRIREWWSQWPDANIGISLEGARLAVLDIEGESHGQDANSVITAVEAARGPIPATRAASTAGGGRHYYFALPPEAIVPTIVTTSDGEPVEGVEVRRPGMYVVTPPSLRDIGSWEWINDLPIAFAPEWMLAETPKPRPVGQRGASCFNSGAKGTPYGLSGLQGEIRGILNALPGHRRIRVFAAAAACAELSAAGQLDDEYAVDELVVAAERAFGSEWEDHKADALRAAQNGWDRGWLRPRAIPETSMAEADVVSGEDSPHSVYIDWPPFWTQDDEADQWLLDGILARGRGHSIWAKHKIGKSLVMLWCALEMVRSGAVVIYLDYEMSEDDLRERLEDMGAGPETDLSLLRYALLPTIPPLDTVAGGEVVIGLVDAEIEAHPYRDVALVIDTIGRAVVGEENPADTIRAFYTHTGIGLKRRGITWARLDHSGWEGAHARGSSAKGDDVDVIWKVDAVDGGLELKREASRMGWVPERVTLHKLEDPLRFERVEESWLAGTDEVANLLDDLGVPIETTVKAAQNALREAGKGKRTALIKDAVRWRRMGPRRLGNASGNASEKSLGNASGNVSEKPHSHAPETDRETLGNEFSDAVGNAGGYRREPPRSPSRSSDSPDPDELFG